MTWIKIVSVRWSVQNDFVSGTDYEKIKYTMWCDVILTKDVRQ